MDPDAALTRLGELSSEIRASVLLDERGRLAAAARRGGRLETADAEGLRELSEALLREADAARGAPAGQVEVRTLDGSVFALRAGGWSVAVVADRDALASLMFYDLRSVLGDLAPGAAVCVAPAGARRARP